MLTSTLDLDLTIHSCRASCEIPATARVDRSTSFALLFGPPARERTEVREDCDLKMSPAWLFSGAAASHASSSPRRRRRRKNRRGSARALSGR